MTEREEPGLGRAERRIEGEIGLHQMMRAAVKLDLLQRPPAKPLEQERVLALDMGEEASAAQRMRRGDGEPDQRRADCADPAVVRRDGEARAAPQAGRLLVDAHRADHPLGDDGERRQRDDRGCDLVQFVAIVALEKPLLVAEDGAAQRRRAGKLPGFGRIFDLELARDERLERLEDHALKPRS